MDLAQGVEEPGGRTLELGEAAEIIDLFGGELQVLKILDRLREPCRHHVIAIAGEPAKEQLKSGDLVRLAGLEVTGRHGELVEVGEKASHYFLAGGAGFTSEAACKSSSMVFASKPYSAGSLSR